MLEIPANGQSDYEIVYNPLTMTTNAEAADIKD